MSDEDTQVRVWIGCLAAYNAGRLHGEWFTVTSDEDELHEAIAAVLKSSPCPNAEEYEFFDTESPIGGFLGRYSSVSEVCALAELIEEHEHDMGMLEAASEISAKGNLKELKETIECYQGSSDSAEQWVEDLAYDSGELSEDDCANSKILRHIDWSGVVNEYDTDGYSFKNVGGTCYVFA